MTPHLDQHPWVAIGRELEQVTGREGIVWKSPFSELRGVHARAFFEAIEDIAKGRVVVARHFLVKLIKEIRCQEMFGLDDTSIISKVSENLPRHELKNAVAPIWSQLIQRKLVEVRNVKFRDEEQKISA